MSMGTTLRITGVQHKKLMEHLFPGDGKEAVAIALCGQSFGPTRRILLVQQLHLVPLNICHRTDDHITWPTEHLVPLLECAADRHLSVVKIHSHPGGFPRFSEQDDRSDASLFPFVCEWTEGRGLHASVVMLPDGSGFGRLVDSWGAFEPLGCIAVVGDDLAFWHSSANSDSVPEFATRHAQLFGAGTSAKLQRLRVAVAGCSGTGSILIAQLAHLGVGRLVLIDPDRVEEKNLNRIVGATMNDARQGAPKVDVMKRYVEGLELGTEVVTLATDLASPMAVRTVAESDVVFGCMDGVEGRHLLNLIASFYLLPYFDLGVRLDADGHGGVDQVCGTVHYLQPGGSSLLSRGVFTLEEVRSAALKRTDPDAYKQQLKEKYIVGVQEDRPAVISVNMQVASMAVNELLARLHPFRDEPNREYAASRVSIKHGQMFNEPDGAPCSLLSRRTGLGDVVPLLNRPDLSE